MVCSDLGLRKTMLIENDKENQLDFVELQSDRLQFCEVEGIAISIPLLYSEMTNRDLLNFTVNVDQQLHNKPQSA